MVKRSIMKASCNKKGSDSSKPTRRKRVSQGKTPCRSSLRCRGISGEDPTVLFPSGTPVFRFPRSEYNRSICRMYGVDRNFKYKGFFFCTDCRVANEFLTTKGMIKSTYRVNGKKNGCEANHSCYAFPTNKGKYSHTMMTTTSSSNRGLYILNQQDTKKCRRVENDSNNVV